MRRRCLTGAGLRPERASTVTYRIRSSGNSAARSPATQPTSISGASIMGPPQSWDRTTLNKRPDVSAQLRLGQRRVAGAGGDAAPAGEDDRGAVAHPVEVEQLGIAV